MGDPDLVGRRHGNTRTNPYCSQRTFGKGKRKCIIIMAGAWAAVPVSGASHDQDPFGAGKNAQDKLQGAWQSPPERGGNGKQAEGEEVWVPLGIDVQDDGDPGLENGRADGRRGARAGRGGCICMALALALAPAAFVIAGGVGIVGIVGVVSIVGVVEGVSRGRYVGGGGRGRERREVGGR